MPEATMIVLDDSEWMRNGDFPPSRWDAQIDATRILFDAKVGSNPESGVGLMTMAGRGPRVLASLTQEMGKILASLKGTEVAGKGDLSSAISIAQLALKHRQNKAQQQRIVVFVGSPVGAPEDDLVALGRKLKKNNVALDVVSFGEETDNAGKLQTLLESVNSGENSHLVTVSASQHQLLSDALLSSPILMGSGGGEGSGSGGGGGEGGGDFGVDPNMDPELAMALRMSLEEEQARQRAAEGSSGGAEGAASSSAASALPAVAESSGAAATSSSSSSGQPSAPVLQAPAAAVPADQRPPATTTAATSAPSGMPSGGSLVPPGADAVGGSGQASADDGEDAMLQQALALSQQGGGEQQQSGATEGRDEDVEMSSGAAAAAGGTQGRATVAGAEEGDDDEEMTEEEAIAHAIQMSLQEQGENDGKGK